MHGLAQARGAVSRFVVPQITVIEQSRQRFVDDEKDIASLAAVAAVGTAPGNEFFAPERNAAATAVAGFDFDFNLIDKFHGYFPHTDIGKNGRRPRHGSAGPEPVSPASVVHHQFEPGRCEKLRRQGLRMLSQLGMAEAALRKEGFA